jgi:threonyl-tRNA synthetase
MKNIIKQNQLFEQYKLPVDEAIKFLGELGEVYKVEMAEDLKKAGETEISFFKNKAQQGQDVFVDMCI